MSAISVMGHMILRPRDVVDAIRAFEAGEIVVVIDDDGRENEGDLIVAAVHCTPEKMAFIVRHTSGIVCTPMTAGEAKRLNLNAMVAENDCAHTTAFTVSVDFKHGTTTGISADDRTLTVRNLANPQCRRRGFRASRPHLSADCPRRRRVDALWPYGGRSRSLPSRRPAADRCHLRTGQ